VALGPGFGPAPCVCVPPPLFVSSRESRYFFSFFLWPAPCVCLPPPLFVSSREGLRHCLLEAEKAGICFSFFYFGLLPASVCLLHCLFAAEKAGVFLFLFLFLFAFSFFSILWPALCVCLPPSSSVCSREGLFFFEPENLRKTLV